MGAHLHFSGALEGIDLEVENRTADEIAFVQVKGVATQKVLDGSVEQFSIGVSGMPG